ncbi:MAG: T9SS type A sorting domain-containing protein [Bacteroidota bacterium]
MKHHFLPSFCLTLLWVLFSLRPAYAQWSRLGSLPSGQVVALGNHGNTLFVATNTNLIYASNNGGNKWNALTVSPNNIVINSMKIIDSLIFVGTADHGIFVGLGMGEKWTQTGTGLRDVCSFQKHAGHIYASSLGDGVFVYQPNDNNWLPFNNSIHAYNVDALASTPHSLLAAGGANGDYSRYNFTTQQWAAEFYTTIAPGLVINKLISTQNLLFAVGGNRVFRSDNDGASWQHDTAGTRRGIDRLIYAAESDCYLITNTVPNGFWTHKRNKQEPVETPWVASGTYVPDVYAYDIIEHNSILYLATSDGLYVNGLSSGIAPLRPATETISVFPNPSSGDDLTIRSSASMSGITVMNALGQVLNTLDVAQQEELVWRPRLNPGIYFLNIRFHNNTTAVHKVIIN